MQTITGRPFASLKPGDHAEVVRTFEAGDMRAWRSAFGDAACPEQAGFTDAATGIVASAFAALVGGALPGPGTTIRDLAVTLNGPLPLGRPLAMSVRVAACRAADRSIELEAVCREHDGPPAATGTLVVVPPDTPVVAQPAAHRLDWLLERCRGLPPMATAVVHPLSADALSGAVAAAGAGLIRPVLVGPEAELRALAAQLGLDLSPYETIAATDATDAAAKASQAAGAGRVQALMKGSLHTDVLLHAVMAKESGLRTGRLLSHCALMSVPTYGRRIALTDAALNIAPDADAKRDICQNAIGFMRVMGVKVPRVGVLAAVETVRTRMPATVDAAILAKMADRGQITGGLVDGPLDLDAALDAAAAATKGIASPVAGAADVLLAPDIEAGNMVYKILNFAADAQAAGLVVGARVPIMLTSRADTAATRRFSAAAAVLYADALARDPAAVLSAHQD